MDRTRYDKLVREVALIMCRRFYWGKHVASDPEVKNAAREIVDLCVSKLRVEETP